MKEILQADLQFTQVPKTILVEFLSPNTNKPLHLGHLRTALLGESLSRILTKTGHRVVRSCVFNDKGLPIFQSLAGYQLYGNGETPQSTGISPDRFVANYYVKFKKEAQGNEELSAYVQDLLLRWEHGDQKVVDQWKQVNTWAYKGVYRTLDELDIAFDATYYESDLYTHGREIVENALQRGLMERDDEGNAIINLEDVNLGKKVLLRNDDTTVYMTQDLYLAKVREQTYNPQSQIYVVGEEQRHHFNQLFEILSRLDIVDSNLYHLWYGLIALPQGRMKSREGTVVDADDLLKELEDLAKKSIVQRHDNLQEEEISTRAKIIRNAALRFYILKYEPTTGFTYDPEESVSFEGETGPYILYAIARIASLGVPEEKEVDTTTITSDEEYALATALSQTQSEIKEAAQKYKPHLIARHALHIAQTFSSFYHTHNVQNAPKGQKNARLALLLKTRNHLELLLDLLGIESLQEM